MDAVGPLISPLLVGRDDLLELAGRRLDEAEGGRGQFLLVAGEAGIGKSRFVGAYQDLARSANSVSRAATLRRRTTMSRPRRCSTSPSTPSASPTSVTSGRTCSIARGGDLDTSGGPRRVLVVDIVELWRSLLGRPTMLVFEDLQWADDLSLEMIAELARSTRDRPLLTVGTYRSDEAPPGSSLRDWRARLLTQRLAEEMRVGPLDRSQTALVTTLILDTGLPAPREVVDAVFERTDGIPLHIEELLGAMSARPGPTAGRIREARVPDTIEDAVLERIGRRSTDDAQAVAARAPSSGAASCRMSSPGSWMSRRRRWMSLSRSLSRTAHRPARSARPHRFPTSAVARCDLSKRPAA